MISQKMLNMTKNNSAIRAMFEEGNRMAVKFGRENVYDFSLGNPNFPAPPQVNEAILDIVQNTDSLVVHGYMSNSGFDSTKKAVADSLNRRFGTSFGPNNILMTVGAAGGLNVVLKSILNPGDEVIAIRPYFVDYRNYVTNYDGTVVEVNAREGDFQIDGDEIERAVTPKTKAIIVNSPNNPTGVVYTEQSIQTLAAVLEKKQKEYGTSIYIVSDEPYRDLVYGQIEVPYLTKYYRNTLVCFSWSKSLSLPGERIGYAVIPSECDDYEALYAACVVATRVSGFINAPSLLQLAVERCVDVETDVSFYDGNRRLLYDSLTSFGYTCVRPDGAFYMWIKTPIEDDRQFCEYAKKYRILAVPGSAFASGGYMRIAYCVSTSMIEKSLPGFEALAKEFGLKEN